MHTEKNKLVVSGYPGCNHAEKRVGYEMFILVLETNCAQGNQRGN